MICDQPRGKHIDKLSSQTKTSNEFTVSLVEGSRVECQKSPVRVPASRINLKKCQVKIVR